MTEPISYSGGTERTQPVMVTTAAPLPVMVVPSGTTVVAASRYAPLTQVTKAAVKTTSGNVLKFHVTNTNAAVRYFQLHNKATAPAATDVPLESWLIPAGTATSPGYVEFEYKAGSAFSVGIGVAVSTTFGTFTDAATANEHIVHMEYI